MIDKIYIPTLGRVDTQITYDNMPDWVKDITYLVVQPFEYELMQEKYPNGNVLQLPENQYGILNTRKWIVEHGADSMYGMIDDDIVFTKRNVDRKTLKKNAEKSNEPFTDSDWNEMLEWAHTKLSTEYTVAGCRKKGFPPSHKQDNEFSKLVAVFFINGSKLYRDKLEWVLPTSEDVHFIIQVLQMGGKIVTSDKYLFSCHDYHTEGGCKLAGRTSENSIRDSQRLADMYPNYIKLKNEFINLQDDFVYQKVTIFYKKIYNPLYGKDIKHNFWKTDK